MLKRSLVLSRKLNHRTHIALLCVIMMFGHSHGVAQHTVGRWSASLRSGINYFITDFNVNKIGFGVEARGMYGVSHNFSVGGLLGYQELKTYLNPNTLGLPYDYVHLHSFPLAALGVYHALPGNKIDPYFYAGLGLLFYQRLDWQHNGLPDDNINTGILLPIGVGAEMFVRDNLSFSAEISYRVLDDKTETVENGGFDSFASALLGAEWYFGRSDADDDDKDGLTNGEERTYGTKRDVVDTDADGLKDGDEVRVHKTDPLLADTDSDGLADGEEIYQWKSDPKSLDSDGDGLTDLEEKSLGTNPVNVDSDGDVLADGDERTAGTDPTKVDTEGDGVSDYLELRTYLTNPTLTDSDQDSLSDGDEIAKYLTDPLKPDTDGGGAIDGVETARGSNPLDPADDAVSTPLPGLTQPLIVQGVTFNPGTAVIARGSATGLEEAFIFIVLLSGDVEVVVHTDNTGNAADNDRLSQQRADALVAWFVEKGIDPKRLTGIGMGAREPIAPNNTEEGRAKNRRIELRVKK